MGGSFRYAGVENGDACYCGNADDKFIPTDPGECNIPCSGDLGQFCGSSWRLQVYETRDPDPETTTQATPNAVFVLDNGLSSHKPMVVTFDGNIFIYLYHFLKTHIQV